MGAVVLDPFLSSALVAAAGTNALTFYLGPTQRSHCHCADGLCKPDTN